MLGVYNKLSSCSDFVGYSSYDEHIIRSRQHDVDLAIEVLRSDRGRLSGTIRDVRARMDALIDDLEPPKSLPSITARLLRWLGLSARARAADRALAAMVGSLPLGSEVFSFQCAGTFGSGGFVPPHEVGRRRIALALDEAYWVLRPYERVRRKHMLAQAGARDLGEIDASFPTMVLCTRVGSA